MRDAASPGRAGLARLTRRCAFMALFAATLLAACSTPPDRPATPPLTHDRHPPVNLDVGSLTVEQVYMPPMQAPHVEHLAPLGPAEAVRNWAKQRITTSGESGRATLTIADASIKEVPLDTEGGLTGFFTTEPAAKYRGRVAVRLETEMPGQTGEIFVRAERVVGMQEDATLNERRQIWYDLVRDLMADLDEQFEETARRRLEPFLLSR